MQKKLFTGEVEYYSWSQDSVTGDSPSSDCQSRKNPLDACQAQFNRPGTSAFLSVSTPGYPLPFSEAGDPVLSSPAGDFLSVSKKIGIYTVSVGDKAAPPVLLISGLSVLHLDWQDVLAALENSFHVIAYDRAGTGFSDPAPSGVSASLYQEVALAREIIIKHFNRPAIIVGHSMGGFIAESLARLYPQHCAKLILLDSSCEIERSKKELLDESFVTAVSSLRKGIERIVQWLWQSYRMRRLLAKMMFYSKPRPLSTLTPTEDKRLNLKIYSSPWALSGFLRELRSYSHWALQRNKIAEQFPLSVPTVVMAAKAGRILYFDAWACLQHRWARQLKQDNPQTAVKFCLFRSRHLAMRSCPHVVIRAIRGMF